jgi:MFS family permease
MKMGKQKLWTKNFILVTLINLNLGLNYFLLMITVSEYAMAKFGVLPSQGGLAAGIFIFGALIARLFSGKYIGWIGQKRLLSGALILSFVTTSFYFAANSFYLLLVARFLHGLSFGSVSTGTGTIVANIVPKERCGEGIGYYGLSVTIGSAIGPFLGILLSRHGSYTMIFTACTIVAALNLVIVPFLSVKNVKMTGKQLSELKSFKLRNFIEPKALPISLVCMLVFFCYSSVLSFLSAYAKEINLMNAASIFFIIFSAVIYLSRPAVGRLFDSKGENVIMYSAVSVLAIGLIIFSQARYGFMLLGAAVFIGLGYGAIQSSGQAIAVKATEKHRLGLATATFFMMGDIGMGTGPLVFGTAISLIGYRATYLGVSIIVAACLFLYFLLHGKNAAHGAAVKKEAADETRSKAAIS